MQPDEQAIRDLIATWQQATAVGDLPQILRLMAEDVVFLVAGQPPMRGREAFAAAFHSALQQVRVESKSEIQEIQVAGEWAYCWSRLSVTITPLQGGAAVRRSGNALSVLRKQPGGAWVLFRDANMLSVEPS